MILNWVQVANPAFAEVHPEVKALRFLALQEKFADLIHWEVTAVHSTMTWVTIRCEDNGTRFRKTCSLPREISTEQLLQYVEFSHVFTPTEYLSMALTESTESAEA